MYPSHSCKLHSRHVRMPNGQIHIMWSADVRSVYTDEILYTSALYDSDLDAMFEAERWSFDHRSRILSNSFQGNPN
jgi:hypothetical protein